MSAALIVMAAAMPFALLALDGVNARGPAIVAAAAELLLAAAALMLLDTRRAVAALDVAAPTVAFTLALAAGAARLVWPLGGFDRDAHAIATEIVKIAGFAACTITGMAIAADPHRIDRLHGWLVSVGGAYVIVALAESAPLIFDARGALGGRFGGTLTNANAAGCAFGIIALVALARLIALVRPEQLYALSARHVLALGTAAGTTFFALAACALTQSRMALAATLALAFVMVLVDVRRHHLPRATVLLAALTATLATAALLASGTSTIDRLADIAPDAQARWRAYRHLIGVVGQAPWLGHGLGSFAGVNLSYQTADSAAVAWNWGAAHNIVLHALIEGGVLTAVPLLAAIAMLVFGALRALRGAAAGLALSRAAGAGLLLVLACAMVDVALNVPAIAAITGLLLGVLRGSACSVTLRLEDHRHRKR